MNIIETRLMEMYLEKLYQEELITLTQIDEIRNIMLGYYPTDIAA